MWLFIQQSGLQLNKYSLSFKFTQSRILSSIIASVHSQSPRVHGVRARTRLIFLGLRNATVQGGIHVDYRPAGVGAGSASYPTADNCHGLGLLVQLPDRWRRHFPTVWGVFALLLPTPASLELEPGSLSPNIFCPCAGLRENGYGFDRLPLRWAVPFYSSFWAQGAPPIRSIFYKHFIYFYPPRLETVQHIEPLGYGA